MQIRSVTLISAGIKKTSTILLSISMSYYVLCNREIQATSGEWMNEFVRRPSRRRDNRVYVPAADIIKRTIRRSWTISSKIQ